MIKIIAAGLKYAGQFLAVGSVREFSPEIEAQYIATGKATAFDFAPEAADIVTSTRDASGNVVGLSTVDNVNLIDRETMLGTPTSITGSRLYTNLLRQTGTVTEIETGGTVTIANNSYGARTIECLSTAAGTAQVTGAITASVLTDSYYVLAATVESVSLDAATLAGTAYWMAPVAVPTEGIRGYKFPESVPVAGQRYQMTFKPSSTTGSMRFGLGATATTTLANGDTIKFKDIAMYKVSALTDTDVGFFYPRTNDVKTAVDGVLLPADAICCIGDSWSDGVATDWPFVLGNTHNHEVTQYGLASQRLDQILTLANTLVADTTRLAYPYYNIPGIAFIQGGVNDLAQDYTAAQMIASATSLLAVFRSRGIVPVLILPVLVSDAANYTEARHNARLAYVAWVKSEGCHYIDCQELFAIQTGAANQTLLTSETGAWIHPSTAGTALLAQVCDFMCQRINRQFFRGVGERTWVVL